MTSLRAPPRATVALCMPGELVRGSAQNCMLVKPIDIAAATRSPLQPTPDKDAAHVVGLTISPAPSVQSSVPMATKCSPN
jgi:hypothetical protein